ncbi:MAG TPA: BatA and WFA domain-containing protein [Gemmatimonadales bacterium]|nr:BatA and WFA domain-containing protein [Gemmatimonadales bacterium]
MIGFLHPWMLAGLAAAGVPVLLHLLQRREPPTVPFPAVRYLITVTQQHQRRLKLQNWLLLAVRTLLIAVIVLAAAGPTVATRGVPGHGPSALVLVVDNSASSAAVVDGTPRLTGLKAAAQGVLARATPDDALWLLTADGVPRPGGAPALGELVRRLEPSPRRMDLGAALATADGILAAQSRPEQIVLLSDMQASAVSRAELHAPLLVGRPSDAPVRNVGVRALAAGTQPWSVDGGHAVVSLAGDSGAAVPLTVRLGTRAGRQALASVGGSTTIDVPAAPGGWWILSAELDPDELRLDDRRVGVVRVAPPARVEWTAADHYLAAAAEVLAANHRVARGKGVTLGTLGPGPSIVEPPADPAAIGALNRALARRGVGWRFGAITREAGTSDSLAGQPGARVLMRHRLEPEGGAHGGVVARVGREPWIVRGADVVLIGSRLEPEWTELPLAAAFMPFVDFLVNRAARGEAALIETAPGDPAPLPDRVTEVRRDGRRWRVEGGATFRPEDPGAYFLMAGDDTVGAISANVDSRESLLAPAGDAQVRALWPGARVMPPARVADQVFASSARGDLRGPLLWTALALGLLEVLLASTVARGRAESGGGGHAGQRAAAPAARAGARLTV